MQNRKEYHRQWHAKRRAPCKICGAKIPVPSPGRVYCVDCAVSVKQYTVRDCFKTTVRRRGEYKMQRGCDICGYNNCASALHFHHIEAKNHKVWVPHGEEFDKCILVCANCHFELHTLEVKSNALHTA